MPCGLLPIGGIYDDIYDTSDILGRFPCIPPIIGGICGGPPISMLIIIMASSYGDIGGICRGDPAALLLAPPLDLDLCGYCGIGGALFPMFCYGGLVLVAKPALNASLYIYAAL